MKILITGGTFDTDGGRPSSLIAKLKDAISSNTDAGDITAINGGHYDALQTLIDTTPEYDIIFWFADVPNGLPKIRDVKSVAPKVMLVTSKRNDNEKYSVEELVQRALISKSNLLFEFSKKNAETGLFNIRIIDPLGCLWYNGTDISEAAYRAIARLSYLKSITRQNTIQSPTDKSLVLSWYFDSFKTEEHQSDRNIAIPDQQAFVDLVRQYAGKLQSFTPCVKTERFIGNASMKLPPQVGRCGKGMPSFKQDGMVFVSRRNVPKQFIEISDFVPVYMEDEKLYYCGNDKPSVDAPVQIRLYDALPNIRYMIHTHSYLSFAPSTTKAIPCGAVEETDEILKTIDTYYGSRRRNSYTVNLFGHGSIIMADSVKSLRNQTFKKRPMPEIMC